MVTSGKNTLPSVVKVGKLPTLSMLYEIGTPAEHPTTLLFEPEGRQVFEKLLPTIQEPMRTLVAEGMITAIREHSKGFRLYLDDTTYTFSLWR